MSKDSVSATRNFIIIISLISIIISLLLGIAVIININRRAKKTATEIQDITKIVVDSVGYLSINSNSLLGFMGNDVDQDYKKMLYATNQYKKDAGYINNLVTDFSATAEELLASTQNMIKAINGQHQQLRVQAALVLLQRSQL